MFELEINGHKHPLFLKVKTSPDGDVWTVIGQTTKGVGDDLQEAIDAYIEKVKP